MRRSCCIVLLLLLAMGASALEVPFSGETVLTPANELTGFERVVPDDRASERLATRAWLWQDGDDLMVHFACDIDDKFEPGAISPKDQPPDADFVRVQLITIPDAWYSYYYAAYPTGTLVDGTRSGSMSVSYDWNSHYSYESDYSDSLWTVTFRIPLAELRFKQSLPYRWKIILTRYVDGDEEYFSLPYLQTDMGNDYFLNAQDIELSHQVKRKLDIAFRPYFVKSYDLVAKTSSYDPEHLGLDIAFNPGQRTRIKVSMNPDFSDIPPDNAQDNYNSKYPPYLSENRFFFTEDLDVFGSLGELFYSRSVVQPQLAYKVTGNSQTVNWGVLGAFDKKITDSGILINPDDYFQVLTATPSWRRFRLSAATVSRVNEDYYNHVGSLGTRWEVIPKVFLAANATGSTRKHEAEGDLEPLQGYSANASLSIQPEHFNANLNYGRVSRDFRADASWIYETDLENINASMNWSSEENKTFVEDYGISSWASMTRSKLSTSPLRSQNAGASLWCSFRPDISLNLNGDMGEDIDLANTTHPVKGMSGNISWYGLEEFGSSFTASLSKVIVYSLYETRLRRNLIWSGWGTIAKKTGYSFSAQWVVYDYPRENLVDSTLVQLDNNYLVINGSLKYTPSQKLQFRGGLSLSTYESTGVYAKLSYYGNLRYEFLPEYFIFAGFKSNQTQDEESVLSDPLGHYIKDKASVYVKLSASF